MLFEFDEKKFCFLPKNENIPPKTLTSTHEEQDSSSFIIVNNSPIEFGHSLIVPRLKSGLNQVIMFYFYFKYINYQFNKRFDFNKVLNQEAIELTTRLALLSKSLNIIFGFNSINAYASVNHLHLHVYYITSEIQDKRFPFPIQNVKVKFE